MSPRFFIVFAFAATAAAQGLQLTGVEASPTHVVGVVYDRVHQRLLAVDGVSVLQTWSFDGARWRPHLPDGLGGAVNPGQALMFVGYDKALDEPVLQTSGASTVQPQMFLRSGGGWLEVPAAQTGALLPYGAAAAEDPLTGTLMTFGGEDRMTGLTTAAMFALSNNGWSAQVQTLPPPARREAALALDRARSRAVLFGGRDSANGHFGDTWEWDGMTWLQATPAASPSPRSTTLAYDASTQTVVAIAGRYHTVALDDCWQWDGSTWTARNPLPVAGRVHAAEGAGLIWVVSATGSVWIANGAGWAPIARHPENFTQSMAYDPTRSQVLRLSPSQLVGVTQETWTWNGTWQQHTVSTPAIRAGTLAPLGNEMFLFGGLTGASVPYAATNAMFAWNGLQWTPISTAQQPAPRYWHTLVNTGAHLLMFGGTSDGATQLGDTWEYDGSNWSPLLPANSPPARIGAEMAFDPLRQRTVLFGGYQFLFGGQSTTPLYDTWEFDGTSWTQFTPATIPVGMQAMTFDPAAGLVAGVEFDGTTSSRIWHWDGVDWSSVGLQNPMASYPNGMVFDAVRQRLLVDTGYSLELVTPTPATATLLAQTCGNAPDIRLLGRPALGTTADVAVAGEAAALGAIAFGLQATSVTLTPGCRQLLVPIGSVFGTLDPVGHLEVPLAIPANAGLLGVTIRCQSVVLDGGPVFGTSLSGALQVEIGG